VTLIDAASLAVRLADVDPPSVLDVRWSLAGPGRPAYLDGHIPGAAFLDLDQDLCGSPGPGGRHPLPDPESLQTALRRAGVDAGRAVVAYDDGDGFAAARLWWTLTWAGHTDVAVLDGGFAAWLAADRPVEPGEAVPPPGDITVRPGRLPVLDAVGAAELAQGGGVLLDARQSPRYRGESEPVDPVAGHIPGAVNLPAATLADAEGRLLPPDRLREAFTAAGVRPGAPVGAYCGSGVVAARVVLALHEAGFDQAGLYVGSWSEWVTVPDRPVAVGGDRSTGGGA